MKAGPRTNQAALSSNSSCNAVTTNNASKSNSKVMHHQAVVPELMICNATLPVTLSCDSRHALDLPRSTASEGIAPVHVSEPGTAASSHTTVRSKTMAEGIKQTATTAGVQPADCTAGSSVQEHQPQPSRASSVTATVPEAPKSPAEPTNSSNSSYHSSASRGTAALAVDESTAFAPPPVVTARPAAAATDRRLPLSPRAAMAAAAAAATAALHCRLMEQQKMGLKLHLPAGPPAAGSLLLQLQQPRTSATMSQQPQSGATMLQRPGSAAATQPGSPAVGTTAAVAAPTGTNQSRSIMMQAPIGASAAIAAPPGQQQQQHHPPRVPAAGAPAAATAAATEEVLIRSRAEALQLYRAKRDRRSHVKKVRYHLRKVNADKRLRIKGRFVSKEEMEKLGLLAPEHVDRTVSCSRAGTSSASLASVQMNACIHPAAVSVAGPADSSTFSWEQQIQHLEDTQYTGTDMQDDLLHSYEDLAHQMSASSGAPTSPAAAAVSSEPPSADLQWATEVSVPSVGTEMPDLPELPAAASLPLHFGYDLLNDHGSDFMDEHHHDLLML